MQHILVLALVAVAAFVVIRQVVGALRLKHGKVGSCCAKGCGASLAKTRSAERVAFLPVESLTKGRSRVR